MDRRLMVVNLHFAPYPFGGGTVVAEACARHLQRQHGWNVLVLTAIRDFNLPEYSVRRYSYEGLEVVAVVINSPPNYQVDYDNPRFGAVARQVLSAFRPDVCHVHAVQGFGVDWFEDVKQQECRLAVTLHDCWWLCDRQFMINADGRYCHQSRVDHEQCRYCTASFSGFTQRDQALRKAAAHADLLLYPSNFHRNLHVASGFDKEKSLVNTNGINLPAPDYTAKQAALRGNRSATVFGFTGGPGEIKGAPMIVDAFGQLQSSDYELQVVDSAQNLGTSWRSSADWKGEARVRFVPAYSQDSMDDFFAGIDVLLFPSQWKESFGLTVREALARDVWVIATDCGAPIENIVDGVNGRIIPFDSGAPVLAGAISEAIGMDWHHYSNPKKHELRSFAQQADELHGFLTA